MAEAVGSGASEGGESEGGILPALQAIKKDPRIGLVGAVQVRRCEYVESTIFTSSSPVQMHCHSHFQS